MTGTKRLSLHGRLRMAAACPDPNAALLAEAADRIERLEAALLMIAIPRVGGGQWASEIARKVMGIGDDA